MSLRHRWRQVLARLVTISVVAGVAAAPAITATPTNAPPPSTKLLLLTASDFAGKAKVMLERHTARGSVRQYGPGLRLGSTRFLSVYMTAVHVPSAARAKAELQAFKSEFRRNGDRERLIRLIGEQLIKGMGTGTLKRSYGGPFVFAGVDAAQFMGTSVTSEGQMRVGIALVQVDRALATLVVYGLLRGEVSREDMGRAVSLARERMRSAFSVASSAPPAVTGVARAGESLSAGEGSWTGGPSTIEFAWSRCDATGSACVVIPGAAGKTYTVDALDVGSTLRVTVTGRNTVSSRAVVSAATPPVVAA